MSGFASINDLAEKIVSFYELGRGDPCRAVADRRRRAFRRLAGDLAAAVRVGPEKMVPGRGRALLNARDVREDLDGTEAVVTTLFGLIKAGIGRRVPLGELYHEVLAAMRPAFGHWVIFDHCMPFNVSRAYDEASGIDHPRIWTAERDVEMWRSLEGKAATDGEIAR